MSTTDERATQREAGDVAAGDPLPAGCDAPIAVHVNELRNLFNAIPAANDDVCASSSRAAASAS